MDASLALSLVRILRRLANDERRTIICSIHQPSTPIFHTFDKLYLLSEGSIVYCGPCNQVADYYASAGYPCPPNYNVADHLRAHHC